MAGKYQGERKLLGRRAQAGLDTLLKNPNVDVANVAAIGFGSGGTAAIEVAKSGARLKGSVSVHGGLDAPTAGDSMGMKGKVLGLHGADDSWVSCARRCRLQQGPQRRQSRLGQDRIRRHSLGGHSAFVHAAAPWHRQIQGRGFQQALGPEGMGSDEGMLRRNLRKLGVGPEDQLSSTTAPRMGRALVVRWLLTSSGRGNALMFLWLVIRCKQFTDGMAQTKNYLTNYQTKYVAPQFCICQITIDAHRKY